MKTIVALIDFSDVTNKVVEQAEKSALQSGTELAPVWWTPGAVGRVC